MTEISLNNSKISIPTSITATALFVSSFMGQNQLPSDYYPLTQSGIKDNIWEDQYLPTILYDFDSDSNKMKIIHNFALTLLHESEDIPEEFAKVINEDFWEII